MTFKAAKKKLKKLAGGRYHALTYELTEHHTGEMVSDCTIYIHDDGHHKGRTWEEAFRSFENPAPDMTEAPQ